jgi:hypothetical protein
MAIDSKKYHKEHVKWVRQIARGEALKCIQEVLAERPALPPKFVLDEHRKSNTHKYKKA